MNANPVLSSNGGPPLAVNGKSSHVLSPGEFRPGTANLDGLVVRQRRVAEELRQIREESRLTGDAVAQRLGWSPSKLSRAERFKCGIPLAEVERLVAFYRQRGRTPGDRLDALLGYARSAAVQRATRQDEAADREEPAAVLEWAAVTIPELLRTPDYARAVLLSTQASTRILPTAVKRSVAATAAWQRRLTSDSPVRLQAVLDESVLYRRFGDAAVMRDQLDHLLAVSALPNVELRVLPLASGGPSGLASFHYLSFDVVNGLDSPDAVVIDRLCGSDRLGEEEETYTYHLAFQQLRAAAGESEMAELIRSAVRKVG